MLYEDLKDGVVSKEDYAELYEGYNSRRKKAEEAVHKLRNEIIKYVCDMRLEYLENKAFQLLFWDTVCPAFFCRRIF